MLKTIKVGPVTYEIKEVPRLIGSGSDGKRAWLNGDVDFQACVIRIEQDAAAQIKAETLWHEAVHAILAQAGYEDHPESMVVALGYGLVQLVRDNPELIEFSVHPNYADVER
jgi:hypothetical protein